MLVNRGARARAALSRIDDFVRSGLVVMGMASSASQDRVLVALPFPLLS
jgi:hypothetical protein